MGDILSDLYLASCVLKRYHDDGANQTDLPFAEWSLRDCEHHMQEAFYGLFDNFPVRPAAWLLRFLAFPTGRAYPPPSDRLGHRAARLMLEASPARDRLTCGIFIDKHESDPVGRLEIALDLVAEADAIDAKLRSAVKSGVVAGLTIEAQLQAALKAGLISADEAASWRRYDALRRACIMVDDFPADVGSRVAGTTPASAPVPDVATLPRKIA